MNLGLGRALSACSASRRSSRVVIFRLIGEPVTMVTAWPMRSTSWASSVAVKIAALGVGFEQQLPAEDLRRLGFPQAGAGHGLFDRVIRGDSLQRAGHRNGQDGGVGLFGRLEHCVIHSSARQGRAAS